jgi:hypothetical protein
MTDRSFDRYQLIRCLLLASLAIHFIGCGYLAQRKLAADLEGTWAPSQSPFEVFIVDFSKDGRFEHATISTKHQTGEFSPVSGDENGISATTDNDDGPLSSGTWRLDRSATPNQIHISETLSLIRLTESEATAIRTNLTARTQLAAEIAGTWAPSQTDDASFFVDFYDNGMLRWVEDSRSSTEGWVFHVDKDGTEMSVDFAEPSGNESATWVLDKSATPHRIIFSKWASAVRLTGSEAETIRGSVLTRRNIVADTIVPTGKERGTCQGRYILNKSLTDITAFINENADLVTFSFGYKQGWLPNNQPFPLLIRLFDRNGSYLHHFTTRELYNSTTPVSQFKGQIDYVALKKNGNRFSYAVPADKAPFIEIIEVGFSTTNGGHFYCSMEPMNWTAKDLGSNGTIPLAMMGGR